MKTTTVACDRCKEVLTAVKSMRDAQRQYFEFRRSDMLKKSKALERQVDKMIAEMTARERQGSLL